MTAHGIKNRSWVTILLGEPTPSQNQTDRMHYRARGRLRDDWCMEIRAALRGDPQAVGFGLYTRAAPGKRRPARGLPQRRITITRYSAGELDVGNMVGGCKCLVDAIVAEGLVWDDSPDNAEIIYRQTKCAKSDARTAVEVSRPCA